MYASQILDLLILTSYTTLIQISEGQIQFFHKCKVFENHVSKIGGKNLWFYS